MWLSIRTCLKRKKRFYVLSPTGTAMLAALTDEWRRINASLDRIL